MEQRCYITPDLNPILLKPVGNYSSIVYLNGKRFKKMHAQEYYKKFVNVEEDCQTITEHRKAITIEKI